MPARAHTGYSLPNFLFDNFHNAYVPFCARLCQLPMLTINVGITAAMTYIVTRLKRATKKWKKKKSKKIGVDVRQPICTLHCMSSRKRSIERFSVCHRQFQLYGSAHEFEWTIFNLISFQWQRKKIVPNRLNVFNWLNSNRIERCHDAIVLHWLAMRTVRETFLIEIQIEIQVGQINYFLADQARRSAYGRWKTYNVRVQTYFQLNGTEEHSSRHIAKLTDSTNKYEPTMTMMMMTFITYYPVPSTQINSHKINYEFF